MVPENREYRKIRQLDLKILQLHFHQLKLMLFTRFILSSLERLDGPLFINFGNGPWLTLLLP
jgi:hypothetical protein